MSMNDSLIAMIQQAFADVEYPGDWCLRGSNEGEEPFLLEREFAGKDDWRTLDAAFIDNAPDGYASALSFFSDEAFRFYLPAYLIADIRGQLTRIDPVFCLCHGLSDSSRSSPVNPRRSGQRTWWDTATHRLSMFTSKEAAAIAAYLSRRVELDGFQAEFIEQALNNYWLERAKPRQ
jgi:hypothetical protein